MIIPTLIFLKGVQQILFNLYLFQLKEYRTDRFMEHAQRVYKTSINSIINLTLFAPASKNKLPKPTLKAISYAVVLVFFQFLLSYYTSVWLAVISLFLSPLLIVVVQIATLPIEWAIRWYIYNQAQKLISDYKNKGLIVIGITGSYGKTSTKEFLTHILSAQYRVLTTEKSINTPLGIARAVTQKLKPSHEVFVVEMGAYTVGEIAEICSIVMPDIGILTTIGNQHLALFGSQEKIIEAKSELAQSLPDNGILFLGPSEYKPILPKTKTPFQVAHFSDEKISHAMREILEKKELPRVLYDNVAGAVACAKSLGLTEKQIIEKLESLPTPAHSLTKKIGHNNALIVNDSFSSNLRGVEEAFKLLSNQKHTKKIVIMPCLIELGPEAVGAHTHIGILVEKYEFEAIFITDEYKDSILSRVRRPETTSKIRFISNPTTVQEQLHSIDENTAILLEGRVPQELINYLENNG